MYKHILSLLVLVVFFSSCSKDNPVGPTGETFTKAKTGNVFVYDEYSTDSANVIIVGLRDTINAKVLLTDGNIGGKSGVLFIEEKRGSTTDTAYYAYESNNNFSVYANPSDPAFPIWETIPTGTGTTIIRETDYSVMGIDTSVTYDSTITSLLGTEIITIKDELVSTKKVQLRFRHVVFYNRVKWIDQTVDNILYYAPSLGFIVRTESSSRQDQFGDWINGSYQTLIDYDLK